MAASESKEIIKWHQPHGKGWGYISCEIWPQGIRLVFSAEGNGDIDFHLLPNEVIQLRERLLAPVPFSISLGRSVDLEETTVQIERVDENWVITVEENTECGSGCILLLTSEVHRKLIVALLNYNTRY